MPAVAPSRSPRAGWVRVARALALSLVLWSLSGCLHPTNNDGAGAINLARAGDFLFVARGSAGLDVVRVSDGEQVSHLEPSGLMSSFDDVSAQGSLLLVLDADDGRLASFHVDAAGGLTKGDEIEVATGPYSGVALGLGRAVVSGGTCEVTLLDVAASGELAVDQRFSASRGQPEVSIDPSGVYAVLSTHFSGGESEALDEIEFGLSLLELESGAIVDTVGLEGAGFTEGGGTPASWPVRVAFRSGAVFVAHGGGLSEVRVADGRFEEPRTVALEGPAVDVAIHGDSAFVVVASPASVAQMDLQDMQVRESLPLPEGEQGTAILVSASRVYVAGNETGLITFER